MALESSVVLKGIQTHPEGDRRSWGVLERPSAILPAKEISNRV